MHSISMPAPSSCYLPLTCTCGLPRSPGLLSPGENQLPLLEFSRIPQPPAEEEEEGTSPTHTPPTPLAERAKPGGRQSL